MKFASLLSARSAGLAALPLALLVAGPAQADITLVEETANRPSVKFSGRIQYDPVHYDADVRGSDEALEMRRFRLALRGGLNNFEYKVEGDFSQDQAVLKDAYVGYDGQGFSIRVGQFKTPNSLLELTSSLDIPLMERGQTNSVFATGRRIGVQVSRATDFYTVQGGVFANQVKDDISTAFEGDEHALSARGVVRPVHEEGRILHLGASARHIDYGGEGTRLKIAGAVREFGSFTRLDFRPGSALGEAEDSLLTGLEALWIDGPFMAQAEIMNLTLDTPAGDTDLQSGYALLGWVLTGEQRGYKTGSGKLGGVEPANPMIGGNGFGALQATARLEYSDFDEAAGGELTTWTAGLSWWLNEQVRIMGEVGRADLEGSAGFDDEVDFVQARFQFDW